MCLIVLAWQARADLPLVVAANRDEWRERPTKPAHWWPEHPSLLAGQDLRAGGTWMGVTRAGRFAAVTNFRDPADKRSTARSRGGLVTEFLLGDDAPGAFLASLAGRASEYNGFNLILGDGASLWYFGSREGEARTVEPGIHGLSNHLLDEPWPKVVRAREAMQRAVGEANPKEVLFDLLSDGEGAPDASLPQTGVGIDWERRLAAPLITGADYGTCSSSFVAVGAEDVRFEERSRDASGAVRSIAAYRFARATSAASSSPDFQ